MKLDPQRKTRLSDDRYRPNINVGLFDSMKIRALGFSDMLIGYMRVSSDNDRQTTDLQRDALLAAGIDERHLYEDRASGAKDNRPGLKAALDDTKPGDCLVVWKLDRLGRSLPHLLEIVTKLQKRGVAFRSLTEQMDTTTPHGELLFNIFGSLAQYERALTRERILAGLEAAKRRGKKCGRPRAISDEQLAAIEQALDSGTSKAAVCRTFGVKRSTLYDAIRAPVELSKGSNPSLVCCQYAATCTSLGKSISFTSLAPQLAVGSSCG